MTTITFIALLVIIAVLTALVWKAIDNLSATINDMQALDRKSTL